MEIVSNIHLIAGVMANPYLLIDPQGLTLIDTGIPGSAKRILDYIHELGYAPQDLKHIIITHADVDHVGGLSKLKAATGARIYASPIEAEAIARGKQSRDLNPSNAVAKALFGVMGNVFHAVPAQVDELVKEGMVLPVAGGLQILETPGHTPGHISLYAPSVRVLFCGDSMVSEKEGLRGSRGMNNWDQAQSDGSVRKQAALGAQIVCSGHGPVVRDAEGKFPRV